MQCKKCHAEIPSENINIQLAIAKCDACNGVFSFYDDVARDPDGASSRVSRFAGVGLPKGLTVENSDMELRIRRKWFSPLILMLTVFTVFWDGFLIVWFFIAFSGGELVMAAAGSLHAAVGLVLTYVVLTGYLNSTLIAVNKDYLIIHHYPLPWPGSKTLNSPEVTQLYSKRVHSSGHRTSGSSSYEVHALLQDGRDVKLIGGLSEDTQALFIEQETEKYLGIADRPVRGEISGS